MAVCIRADASTQQHFLEQACVSLFGLSVPYIMLFGVAERPTHSDLRSRASRHELRSRSECSAHADLRSLVLTDS